jgi:hypothetical protein
MPIRCKRDGFSEERSLYAPLIEYRVMTLALDHFFKEVVEGNLPLSGSDNQWWEQGIVPERVNRYSKNWCVLYECLSQLRERIESQGVYADQVQIDANLDFTFKSNRREHPPEPIEWTEDEE